MQIPQLSIDPLSQAVKTLTGKNVSMFINYVPASSEDLSGMRTEDVLRVEVLEYPEDPRFNSAPHVVNFIMYKYEWGGYTKFGTRGWLLNEYQGAMDLYTKYVRKRWSLDASASGNMQYTDCNRGHNTEIYRDVMFRGSHYDELYRLTDISDYYKRSNNAYGSARVAYSSDSLYIQHIVGFSRQAVPGTMTRSVVGFSDQVSGDNLIGEHRENNQALSPWFEGYYWINMPKGNSLSISWNFSYSSRKRYSEYDVEAMTPIFNINREKTYRPNANLSYSKRLGHGNTFRTSLMTFNTVYHTDYYGSYNGRQSLLSSENMLFLEYMQKWSFGLNLYSRIGISNVIGRVNGHTNLKQWNPRLGLQLQYKINDSHNASIEGWWGNNHPAAMTSNTALVQSNELLWLQGNPELKNTIFQQATASYSFIPSNRFSLAASAEYEGYRKKQAIEYFVLPGYDGVVRRTVNSGNGYQYSAWLSASSNFFDNKLRINFRLQARRLVLTGLDSQRCNMITGNATISYYLKNFNVNVRFVTPQKSVNAWSEGIITRYPCIYELYASYTIRNLQLSASFTEWFNDGTRIRTSYIGSPHYSENGWSSGNFNRGLFLSASYTLTYGKKVNMNNELRDNGTGRSAILQ